MSVRRSRKAAARKKSSPKRLSPGMIGAGVAALAAVPAANAATFNVTNLNDDLGGSLRQAIVDANTSPGADVITFQSGLTGTITLTSGQLEITDSVDIQGPGASTITVSGNNSSRVFYLYNGSSTIDVRIAGLTITQGNDSIGGGVVDFDENLVLDGVTITANTSQGQGGGLWADGFNMNLTIMNSTISGNIATGCGGGIYVEDTGGPLLIDNSVITGNQSSCNGGGIYFYDPDDAVTIRDTTISGNHADFLGGGIYLYDTDGGPFIIERSTISGNDALAGGGLAFYGPDDAVLIENSTISGNQATAGSGGGLYLYSLYAGGTLNFVTLTNNTAAGDGGGMAVAFGTVTISNSILADNTGGTAPDLSTYVEGPAELSYSLLESTAGASYNDNGGNIFSVDPQLAALANNGGPTQTQRPALTSPVVNAADPAFAPPPATDQRGQPRIYPVRADMGALELVGGVLQFNPTTYNVNESTPGSVTLTVVRDIGPDPASVDFTTNPGTATAGAGNDFTTTIGTLNFAPGDLSETFVVPILDDATAEGNEQFTATLGNPSIDATIAAGTATVTIVDDPAGTAQWSAATASTPEGAGSVTLSVTRIGGTEGALAANYTTANGSAGAPSDYATTSGTVTFPAGDATPQPVVVPIVDDSLAEGNEDFTVALTGAAIGSPGTATVTIVDDPAGTAQFTVSSINTAEDGGTVTLTVTRTGGTEGPLAVNYATADGTAVAPSDYTTTSGTITFPAGDATPQSFNIPINNDNLSEGDEMFNANLTGAVGTPSSVTIVITANDEAPIPTVSFLGKLLLAMFSAMAGLYALVRNRLSAVFFALLIIGVAAGPTLSAGPKHQKEQKGSKLRGTLVSVTNDGTTMVLTLSGGLSISLPTKSVTVVDARKAKRQAATLQQVVQGANVVVKTETDANGAIVKAKIKLTAE